MLLIVLLLFLIITPVAQATVYASPDGSDSSPGTSAEPVRSIGKAASIAVRGHTVIDLAPGAYDRASVPNRPTEMTTIRGPGAVVSGFNFKGGANFTVEGLTISGSVVIDSTTGLTNTPHDFVIEGNDVRGSIRIQNAARNVRVSSNHIHDSTTGVVGPGRVSAAYTSSNITIDGNVIERMSQDGMQIADWSDVLIEQNVIRGVRDPGPCDYSATTALRECTHNDNIQCSGGCTRVRILNNSLGAATLGSGVGEASAAIQFQGNTPAVPRPTTNVEISGNTFGYTVSAPLQTAGSTAMIIRNNTGCLSKVQSNGLRLGAIFIAKGGVPSSGLASWNVLPQFTNQSGSTVLGANQLVGQACGYNGA